MKPHVSMPNRCFMMLPDLPCPHHWWPCWTLQNMCFTMFQPLGHQKHHVFPSFQQSPIPPTIDSHSGPLQNTCFTMFEPLGHQKLRVFRSLGSDGSDGQVCRMIGRSWLSKVAQKCPKSLPLGISFWQSSVKQRHPERDGSQVALLVTFFDVSWRVRPSIRSRRRNRNTVFHFRPGL